MEKSMTAIAESKAQLEGQAIISRAINERFAAETNYRDLVYIHKDSDGRIVLIQPNTCRMNRIMAQTVSVVERDLDNLQNKSFKVPLGQAMGIRVFAGYGPGIKVKMMPVGQVTVDMNDHFQARGINQTRHLIYMKISAKIKIVAPLCDEEVKVVTTVPLAETIIVGQVPGTYVDISNKGDIVRPGLISAQ